MWWAPPLTEAGAAHEMDRLVRAGPGISDVPRDGPAWRALCDRRRRFGWRDGCQLKLRRDRRWRGGILSSRDAMASTKTVLRPDKPTCINRVPKTVICETLWCTSRGRDRLRARALAFHLPRGRVERSAVPERGRVETRGGGIPQGLLCALLGSQTGRARRARDGVPRARAQLSRSPMARRRPLCPSAKSGTASA
jgi:hypothetical protein